jgi:Fe-S-cluster-containing dehydrogenase component
MDTLSRRNLLTTGGRAIAGAAIGTAAGSATASASEPVLSPEALASEAEEQWALLFDSTRCVGCRACEMACSDANELGKSPDDIFEGRGVNDARALAPDTFTYVTQHDVAGMPGTTVFGKVQCMHCIEPACASSCPVAALEKTPEGPVVWHGELCLGCRYCMMACPFLVPRFEWHSRNPEIRKCEMCYQRQREGKRPACAEVCPTGALKAGKRGALLQEAWARIAERPRDYVHHVYGEHEAGGTNFLHIAARPFEELGYRANLPTDSYRSLTRPAMATIPYVLNGLGVVLGFTAWIAHRKHQLTHDDGYDEGDEGREP